MSDTNKRFLAALEAIDTAKYSYEPLSGPAGLTTEEVNIDISTQKLNDLSIVSNPPANAQHVVYGGDLTINPNGGLTAGPSIIGHGCGLGPVNNGYLSQPSMSIQDALNNMVRLGLHSPLVNSVDDVIKLLRAKLISKTTAIRLVFPNSSAEEHQRFLADIVDDIILGDEKDAT